MRELKLSNSDKLALVDDEDHDRLLPYKWNYNGIGISRTENKRNPLRLSRRITIRIPLANEILNIRGVIFDHKDRNAFNNLKSNLRECTQAQNTRNKSKCKYATSQYIGVSYHSANKKWQSGITSDGVKLYLGTFLEEKDAAIAYDIKARELHGEFANLNFP